MPPSLKAIELEVTVAGQQILQTFPATPNQTTTFLWDGKDALGRDLQGRQKATVRVGYTYDGVYQRAARFGYNGNGIPIAGSITRREVTLNRVTEYYIGPWDARPIALGAWSLDVHHAYDPSGKILYQGDGTRRSVQTVNATITTVAGNGVAGFAGDNVPAANTPFFFPFDAVAAANGELYVADSQNRRIRKVDLNGIVTTVVGTGANCVATQPCGDGGQAVNAQLGFPSSVSFGPDGSLFIVDAITARVRKVAPNGVITTAAGTGVSCADPTSPCGDGGPATLAQLSFTPGVCCSPTNMVAADGTLYITDGGNRRVRRVGPDGIIATVAGSGRNAAAGGCTVVGITPVNATSACLEEPFGVTAMADGTVYFTDVQLNQIFRVTTNGFIRVVAGDGVCGNTGDGGPAATARLCKPEGIAHGPDGALYFSDWNNARIRRIDASGVITAYAATGALGFGGDGGAALAAQMRQSIGVRLGVDGALYIGDANNHRIRKISPPLPGFNNSDIAIPSQDGNELFKFNGSGRHLQTLNTLTGAVKYSFSYDGAGRLTTITDGDGNVTSVQRDGSGNPTGITGPFGQVTTLTVDGNGYLASIANPAGESYVATYSADGLMLSFKDPKNQTANMTFDALGRLTNDADPAGGTQNLARTLLANGNQVGRTTGLNRVTTYIVEELASGNRQRTVTPPDGLNRVSVDGANGTNTLFEPDGTTTTTTLRPDPRWALQAPLIGTRTVTTPGALNLAVNTNRVVALSNPANPLSLTTLTDTTNINGRVYTETYTASTKTTVASSPLGRLNTAVIDSQGRLSSAQVGSLLAANYSYDSRGRLATVTQGSGLQQRLTAFNYNPQGFLSSVVDAEGRTTSFTYDLAGRALTQTRPDGKVLSFAYDANGNRTSIAPPGRPAYTFNFSPVNFTSSYSAPAVAGGGTNQMVYAYNLDRQLDLITRPDGQTLDFAYDTAGRLSTFTIAAGTYTPAYSLTTGQLTDIAAPGGVGLAFTYDGMLPKSSVWSGTVNGTVARIYDNNFRISTIAVNGAGIAFGYDNDGLLTQAGALALTRHPQHGLVTATALNTIADSWGYNGFGELNSYSASAGATALYSAQYNYDRLGRVTQKIEAVQGASDTYDYSYDGAGRLFQVQKNNVASGAYTYDDNGNRLTGPGFTSPTYDNQDRLLSHNGNVSYTYTANGELATKTEAANTTTYQYDALGNLRAVALPGGTQIDYVIDGQNRRIGKRVGGVLTQGFLYEDQLRITGELDGSNNVVSRFVYGSRPNVPDYMVKAGTTYRLIADHLGSVRLVANAATGVVAQRLDYDEFGKVINDTNPNFQPFGFAGGLYDSQTALVRYGARDYDPATGRWTAQESLGFAGGDTNLYAYVLNNPINLIDPNGLQAATTGPPIVNVNVGASGISVTAGPVTVSAGKGGVGVGMSGTSLVGGVNPADLLRQIVTVQAELAALKALQKALGKACPSEIKKKINELEKDLARLQNQFQNLQLSVGQSPLYPGGPNIPSVFFQ